MAFLLGFAHELPSQHPDNGGYNGCTDMGKNGGGGPAYAACLQQGDNFCREGRKGRQTTAKARNDEKTPLRRNIVGIGEEGNGQADNVAANDIGNERSGRERRKKLVEPLPQLPAQQGTQSRSEANGDDGVQHEAAQVIYLMTAS